MLTFLLMVLPLVSGCGRRHTVTTPSPFGDGDFNPKRLPISQDSSSQPLIACRVYTLDKDVEQYQACPHSYTCSESGNQLTYGEKTLFVHHCNPDVPENPIQDQMVCQIKKGPGVVDFISCPTGAACDESNSVYFKMASGEQLIISFCVLSTKNLMNALLMNKSCSVWSHENFLYEERGCPEKQNCLLGPVMYNVDGAQITSHFCESTPSFHIDWLSLLTNAKGNTLLASQTNTYHKESQMPLPLTKKIEVIPVSTTINSMYDDSSGVEGGSGFMEQSEDLSTDIDMGGVFEKKESFHPASRGHKQKEFVSENPRPFPNGELQTTGTKQGLPDLASKLRPRHRDYFGFLNLDDPDINQRISDLNDDIRRKEQGLFDVKESKSGVASTEKQNTTPK